jgi:hypothetical protein
MVRYGSTARRILVILYVTVVAVLLGWQIFLPPFVGLADNGDFAKIAGHYDLGTEDSARNEYIYFVSDYKFAPKFHWNSRIVSSEHMFTFPAAKLSRIFLSAASFDIRILGLAHLIALLIVFLGAGLIFTVRISSQLVLLAVTGFVFTDVAYATYLNSFYMDTVAMIALLATTVCTLALSTESGSRRVFVPCFAVSSIMLITSKTQHSILAIPVSIFAVGQILRSHGRMRATWVLIICSCLLTMALMFRDVSPDYRAGSLFTVIFFKLGRTPDPARDLREVGVGPEYLPFLGKFAYSAGVPINDPAWRERFLSQTGYGRLLLFYVRHPKRAAEIIRKDLEEFGWRHPDKGIANYRREDGFPPGSRSSHFALWNQWRSYLFVRYPFHTVVILAISLLFCILCVCSPETRQRLPAWLSFLSATLMALLTLGVATLTDAVDTARHLFLFHVCVDVVICFWISALLQAGSYLVFVLRRRSFAMNLTRNGGPSTRRPPGF